MLEEFKLKIEWKIKKLMVNGKDRVVGAECDAKETKRKFLKLTL